MKYRGTNRLYRNYELAIIKGLVTEARRAQ